MDNPDKKRRKRKTAPLVDQAGTQPNYNYDAQEADMQSVAQGAQEHDTMAQDAPVAPAPRPGQLTQPGTTPVEPEPPGQLTVPGEKEAPSQAEPPSQLTRPGVDKQGPTPDKMKKGVYLSALIYVEGFQEPAADFNALATSLLEKSLKDYFAMPHEGVSLSLKDVNVQNDVEQDDGDGAQSSGDGAGKKTPAIESKKEKKFQF